MILYDCPFSSCAQKVKIALREKGVAFASPSSAQQSAPTTSGTPHMRYCDPVML